MIKRINTKILTAMKKHTFYYRIMIPFSILSIIIISVTALISWRIISDRYETEIKESNANVLTQVQIYTDQYIYDSIMSIINTNFLNITAPSDIEQFFTYGRELKASKVLGAFQNIGNLCSSVMYVENITLYHKKDDVLLDTGYGLCYDASFHAERLDESIPFTFYNKASENLMNRYSYLTVNDGLTLLRAIPLYSDFGHNTGYIAVDINRKQLMEDIKYKYSLQGGLIILDGDGRVLLEDSENLVKYEVLETLTEIPEDQNFITFVHEGKEYSLFSLRSETSKWTYLYYLPLDVLNADSIATGQLVIICAILVITFTMIVIQIISNRVYQPLKNLRSKMKLDERLLEDVDDVAAMQNTFSFLESKLEDMKETLSRNQSILQYKSLLDILYGNHCTEESIYEQLQLCGITFMESRFCLVIIEIEKNVFDSLSLEQREYMTAQFQEFIKDWYKNDVIQMTESHPDNRIVALLNLNLMHYSSLLDEEEQLLNYLQDNLHIAINIAISECTDNLVSISRLYANTCDYLKYSFLYNYGNVFTGEKIALFERSQLEISLKQYQEIEQLMRNDNLEELMQIVDDYLTQIYANHYSYHSVNSFLMQLYGISFRIGREFAVFEGQKDKKDKIVREFEQARNLTQSVECILMILYTYRDLYHKKNDKNNLELIQQISEYIRENSLEDITLASVAEQFHVSTGHLSRLFKSIAGENFSTFVVDKKLEKAAELLLKERDLSVNEIAEKVGYYSPAYFTRLFKNKYGVTPSAYRKNKHHDLGEANI